MTGKWIHKHKFRVDGLFAHHRVGGAGFSQVSCSKPRRLIHLADTLAGRKEYISSRLKETVYCPPPPTTKKNNDFFKTYL